MHTLPSRPVPDPGPGPETHPRPAAQRRPGRRGDPPGSFAMVAAQRHQRADPGHRARHRRRQHPASDRRRRAAVASAFKQILLRAGIILYGLRLTFQDIAGVGLHGVLLDPDARQHLRPGVPARHPAVRPGPHHHPADRCRQFDLRRRRGDGHRAGRAWPRRTGRGGGFHRGGVRRPGHLPLSGAVPARPDWGCYRATLAPGACTSVPRCTRWARWSPRVARSASRQRIPQ